MSCKVFFFFVSAFEDEQTWDGVGPCRSSREVMFNMNYSQSYFFFVAVVSHSVYNAIPFRWPDVYRTCKCRRN